ncbi:hypothetical protein GCM10011492_09370 [Flexivirga endophytica]|uniref:Uncharacterized protein n=1 Tax=Flexivirga endophytica TaxID=1849103 RepID=A0A916WQZ6_9MICO|nr:hypothetical protein GCM10011492_09370 [Flexivirga endophytica]GHB59215.1 hypothetical protein GCM10008112_30390 [Flexivirga endophytica]
MLGDGGQVEVWIRSTWPVSSEVRRAVEMLDEYDAQLLRLPEQIDASSVCRRALVMRPKDPPVASGRRQFGGVQPGFRLERGVPNVPGCRSRTRSSPHQPIDEIHNGCPGLRVRKSGHSDLDIAHTSGARPGWGADIV